MSKLATTTPALAFDYGALAPEIATEAQVAAAEIRLQLKRTSEDIIRHRPGAPGTAAEIEGPFRGLV